MFDEQSVKERQERAQQLEEMARASDAAQKPSDDDRNDND